MTGIRKQTSSLSAHRSFLRSPIYNNPSIEKLTSSISALVLLSSGSLKSVYRMRIEFILELAYWYSLLLLVIMITAISTSQRILSSYAFLRRPALRLLNVIFKKWMHTIIMACTYTQCCQIPVCFSHQLAEWLKSSFDPSKTKCISRQVLIWMKHMIVAHSRHVQRNNVACHTNDVLHATLEETG